MVRSIKDIGHVMGKKIVAESVESDAVRARRCARSASTTRRASPSAGRKPLEVGSVPSRSPTCWRTEPRPLPRCGRVTAINWRLINIWPMAATRRAVPPAAPGPHPPPRPAGRRGCGRARRAARAARARCSWRAASARSRIRQIAAAAGRSPADDPLPLRRQARAVPGDARGGGRARLIDGVQRLADPEHAGARRPRGGDRAYMPGCSPPIPGFRPLIVQEVLRRRRPVPRAVHRAVRRSARAGRWSRSCGASRRTARCGPTSIRRLAALSVISLTRLSVPRAAGHRAACSACRSRASALDRLHPPHDARASATASRAQEVAREIDADSLVVATGGAGRAARPAAPQWRRPSKCTARSSATGSNSSRNRTSASSRSRCTKATTWSPARAGAAGSRHDATAARPGARGSRRRPSAGSPSCEQARGAREIDEAACGARGRRERRSQTDTPRIRSACGRWCERKLLSESNLDQARARRDAARARRVTRREARLETAARGHAHPSRSQQAQAAVDGARAALAELETDGVTLRRARAARRPRRGAALQARRAAAGRGARSWCCWPTACPTRASTCPSRCGRVRGRQPRSTLSVDGVAAPLQGTVRYVSAEATFTPYYALTQKDRSRLSYLAEITLDDPAAASCRPACRSRCALAGYQRVTPADRRMNASRAAIVARGLTRRFGSVRRRRRRRPRRFRARASTASSGRTVPASRRPSACCAVCCGRAPARSTVLGLEMPRDAEQLRQRARLHDAALLAVGRPDRRARTSSSWRRSSA